MEDELRKLSHAIEQSPSAVMITNSKGSIEYVNPKFTQVTGYTPEEVLGKNPRILKSDTIPSEEYRQLWETITSGGEWRGEFCNKRKDGGCYWEYASISGVRNHKGDITHFIAVKEDITERKRAEDERNKHIKELENLMSYSTIMNDEVHEETLLRHMSSAIQEHFNPDIMAIIMLDRERNMLYVPLIEPSMPVSEFIKNEVIYGEAKQTLWEIAITGFVLRFDCTNHCLIQSNRILGEVLNWGRGDGKGFELALVLL
ncbi:MAG: PAS domain S-box protein [Candidatus Jettenia sp.]|nr:PAS domain S-box protein [Candidatus Jettenia sp.]